MNKIIKLLLFSILLIGNILQAITLKDSVNAIKSSENKLSWAYYKNKGDDRWYISQAKNNIDITIYSLMPLKDTHAGWARVSKTDGKIDLNNEEITIGDIPDNPSFKYYDAGWKEYLTNPKIQSDIDKIKNSIVPIKWWFFKASDNKWYIINKKGSIYKFASKDETYDWQNIDMGASVPEFYIEDGVKWVRFGKDEETATIFTRYTLLS